MMVYTSFTFSLQLISTGVYTLPCFYLYFKALETKPKFF